VLCLCVSQHKFNLKFLTCNHLVIIQKPKNKITFYIFIQLVFWLFQWNLQNYVEALTCEDVNQLWVILFLNCQKKSENSFNFRVACKQGHTYHIPNTFLACLQTFNVAFCCAECTSLSGGEKCFWTIGDKLVCVEAESTPFLSQFDSFKSMLSFSDNSSLDE
jgi:hypothetical protein